jgi:hypothetical protein
LLGRLSHICPTLIGHLREQGGQGINALFKLKMNVNS